MAHEHPPFAYELQPSTGALVDARHRFEQWLASQTIDAEDRDDLAVAMSELGANAITAADGQADAAIALRAWRDRGDVLLEVENAPRGHVGSIVFHGDDDPLRGSGRGLTIVAAYTDAVEVIPPDPGRGLIVRCRKHCSRRTTA